MTLVSTIIKDAYRESNLIAIGTEPSGAQEEEGLRLLQRILESVYGTESGEELIDFPVGNNNTFHPAGFPWAGLVYPDREFIILPNSRLIVNITSPLTLYLNPKPKDGERFGVIDTSDNLSANPLTVVGNGRTVSGNNEIVFDESGSSAEYIYRADLGEWTLLSPITTASLWPFPQKFDDMFVILLAVRLNPRNDIAVSNASVTTLKSLMVKFKAKYRQSREMSAELALLRTIGNRRYYTDTDGATLFDTGLPYFRYY